MPKFVIQRNIPGAGQLSPTELQGVAEKSCGVLREMGPDIQWLHSWVAEDHIFCIYIAPDEERVREHARKGGFPADGVFRVEKRIDPTTAEGFLETAVQPQRA